MERKKDDIRLPPSDLKAEQAVIGCILRDNSCMDVASRLLKMSSFYSHHNQLVFDCMFELIVKRRSPCDPVTLADIINERGWFDDIGGPGYIIDLWDAGPSIASVQSYAEIVRGCAIKRAVAILGHKIEQDAMEPGVDWKTILDDAERALFGISNRVRSASAHPFANDVDAMLERMDDRKKNGDESLLKTRIRAIDLVTGGIDEGNVVVIGARVGVGKTVVAINLAMNFAEDGLGVLIVSLEQPGVEIAQRVIASRSRVEAHQIRKGVIEQRDEDSFFDAVKKTKGLPVWISDEPRQTVYDISATIRQYVAKHGVKVVFIDYLQLITPENRSMPRHEQVGDITRQLKLIARETGVRVFEVAQINRESEKGADKRPHLHQLRESGSIEADCDIALLLYVEENRPNEMEVLIPKNRHGIEGIARVHFDRQHLRILDRV